MTTPFQDAAEKASAALDDVFGEAFTFLPMTAGLDANARPSADPDRDVVAFTAVFIDTAARAHSGPARTPDVVNERPGHSSSRPQITFALAALPYRPRRGDRVQRAADNALFQIAEPRAADPVRITVDLNRV